MPVARFFCLLLAFSVSSLASQPVSAAPFAPNDILVSIGSFAGGSGKPPNAVLEFTSSGALVQTIPFTYNGSTYPTTEHPRDIIVAPSGTLYGYNGTFAPYLTAYQPTTNTFTNTTVPGWSTVAGSAYGSIGAFQNYIYLSDMDTNGAPAKGIIRYDTNTDSFVRFATNLDCARLTVGLDGKIYAPFQDHLGRVELNVYDPVTMALVRNVTLEVASFITAVDQAGRIFAGYGPFIYRLNVLGQIEASLNTGVLGGGFVDIDVSGDGRLVLSQEDGEIVLSDTNLDGFTKFKAINDPNVLSASVFVAFASPAGVPDGGSSGLLLVMGVSALLLCKVRFSFFSTQKDPSRTRNYS